MDVFGFLRFCVIENIVTYATSLQLHYTKLHQGWIKKIKGRGGGGGMVTVNPFNPVCALR